ncbi:MAG: GatB/YqeY domain-containing protein [Candidatus Saccharibacteria bacterium]
MLEQQLEQDIKTALLAGEKVKATTLRGLKATLLNVKVASGKREAGLTDDEVLPIFRQRSQKSAKRALISMSKVATKKKPTLN